MQCLIEEYRMVIHELHHLDNCSNNSGIRCCLLEDFFQFSPAEELPKKRYGQLTTSWYRCEEGTCETAWYRGSLGSVDSSIRNG